MISLQDARLTNAVPASLAAQAWVQALAFADGQMRARVFAYLYKSQIYTALDTCSEDILDVLAAQWRVTWYDTGYPVDIKRKIIKGSMEVRRYLGTTWATKKALRAMWADSDIEEWFDYDGEPGCFRAICNVTDPSVTADVETIESTVMLYKRAGAHLDGVDFMVRRRLKISKQVEVWSYNAPFCGTIYCGTWWMPATLGWSENRAIAIGGKPEAFAVCPEFTGTLPETATVGYSVCGAMYSGGAADAYAVSPEFAGTLPEEAQHGE